MLGRLTRWLWRRVPHAHVYYGFTTHRGSGAACRRCGFVGFWYPSRPEA